MTNEVIKVQENEQGEQHVSARELHKALEAKYKFARWFEINSKMFEEGVDFTRGHASTVVNNGAVRMLDDYNMTVEMAKHIAMMSGTEKGAEVRNYFIAVEKEHKALMNDPRIQMAMGLQSAQLLLDHKDKIIEEMKPKAIFADAVNTSKQSILVGDLAKLISQNGVKIGQNRLFAYMRDNGYLHKSGSQYNRPTQRYIDQGLFEVKESSHTNPDGSTRLTFTTKVTGKGQQYFVNKFLADKDEEK
ncbi:oxidoreductase [Weissella paramesenteroides]|uniref:phage antirepressor KilAC domain-containing protein n=1 Tax=Weissella paramesenteroides TaxID=1249 RepID=UPI0021AF2C71|nr:phage antirepressor KilAC domain-containing protein [Weissella paramesenteroides]MCS9983971.1 oxidoreductase [Weissella paramesenteroides]MCS9998983.1 oxidoreductase [Weissella paramesenteroides]MCT0259314.1 oxidoreductase [Weissella paramesenteroides]